MEMNPYALFVLYVLGGAILMTLFGISYAVFNILHELEQQTALMACDDCACAEECVAQHKEGVTS